MTKPFKSSSPSKPSKSSSPSKSSGPSKSSSPSKSSKSSSPSGPSGPSGPSSPSGPTSRSSSEPHAHRNEIHLVGRVAREPVVHRMPSGDAIVSLWLVVKRPPITVLRRGRQSVDTLELVAWAAPVKEIVETWRPDDVVAVGGSLRHRFWQSEGGLRSKYEVELDDVVLLHRPETGDAPTTAQVDSG